VLHARAYYTAEALGKTAVIEPAFFAEFHTKRNYLDTEEKIADLFAEHGVDAATFKSTFNSFAINMKLKRAEELVTRYGVQATPTIVVNGKFVTTGDKAGSYANWFAMIDELAAREHSAAATAAR
jgi:thiol:disulfide interchange protein DsbA